jgi:hypothetical protein
MLPRLTPRWPGWAVYRQGSWTAYSRDWSVRRLIGGIAWGLALAGLAVKYIVITCLIVGGIGIMMAASRTRVKDSP